MKYETRKQASRLSTKARTLTNSKLFDTGSKGIGKYVKTNKPISGRAYRLEKNALRNERLAINSKPEIIKAAGQALAMNITPNTASYAAGLGLSKANNTANQKINSQSSNQINNLVNGGIGQAGTSNEEELNDLSYNPK